MKTSKINKLLVSAVIMLGMLLAISANKSPEKYESELIVKLSSYPQRSIVSNTLIQWKKEGWTILDVHTGVVDGDLEFYAHIAK